MSAITSKITQYPSVTWDWVYWIEALLFCGGLSIRIGNDGKDSELTTDEERKQVSKLKFIHLSFSILAFVTFALIPRFAMASFGWLFKTISNL
jgi:hypothetical protein